MADFITLTCPSCGGKLEIRKEFNRFACGFCGNEHLVNRSEGAIWLTPIVEQVKAAGEASKRVASEYAIRRLEQEIPALQQEAATLAEQMAWIDERIKLEPEKKSAGMDSVPLIVLWLLVMVGCVTWGVRGCSYMSDSSNYGAFPFPWLTMIGLVGMVIWMAVRKKTSVNTGAVGAITERMASLDEELRQAGIRPDVQSLPGKRQELQQKHSALQRELAEKQAELARKREQAKL